MNEESADQWIADGEKFALLALDLKSDQAGFTNEQIGSDLAVLTRSAFKMPTHWREWLGSIRAEEVEDCDLFVLAKQQSPQTAVLDAENQALQSKVWAFYRGLLLVSRFADAHKPAILTGARETNEIGVRQIHDVEASIPCLFRGYPEVSQADLRQAARLAEDLRKLHAVASGDSHWRLFRVLHLYFATRSEPDLLDRLHQYARCIDGLVLTRPGKGLSDFKTRTALFVGSGHSDQMGDIYADRNTVEHLHEDRLLEPFDREKRLALLQREAIVEYVARTSLKRIVKDENLWPHFANRSGLERFWALPVDEQRAIWGPPVNPNDVLTDFDPKYIHDGLLSA